MVYHLKSSIFRISHNTTTRLHLGEACSGFINHLTTISLKGQSNCSRTLTNIIEVIERGSRKFKISLKVFSRNINKISELSKKSRTHLFSTITKSNFCILVRISGCPVSLMKRSMKRRIIS